MLAKRVAEKIFYRIHELSTLLYFKALFDYVNHSLTLLRPFAKFDFLKNRIRCHTPLPHHLLSYRNALKFSTDDCISLGSHFRRQAPLFN